MNQVLVRVGLTAILLGFLGGFVFTWISANLKEIMSFL